MDAIDIGLQSRNEPKVRDAPRSTGSDVIIEPVTVLLSSPAAIGSFFCTEFCLHRPFKVSPVSDLSAFT